MQMKPIFTAKQIGKDQMSLLFDSYPITYMKKSKARVFAAQISTQPRCLPKQGNNWMNFKFASKQPSLTAHTTAYIYYWIYAFICVYTHTHTHTYMLLKNL